MADNNEAQNQGMPTPDPALKRLNRLVGTWSMKGHPIGSDEDSITGTAPHSNGCRREMMTVLGFPCSRTWIWIMQVNQSSHEFMGYNPKTKAFSSYVYSKMLLIPTKLYPQSTMPGNLR
jgi:hypothetical protein